MISLKEIPMDFCIHPIKFYCEYLRKSVLNVMAESQRERLNLYLADLLLIPPRCDSCKQEWERRRSFVYPILSRHAHVPVSKLEDSFCLASGVSTGQRKWSAKRSHRNIGGCI
ncbi:uncharacterized protein TNCV_3353021 [Trichonephila clavipes]|nr:uncharacterized protein TNCV_3353021 [Trichonephila clavipes]